MLIKCVIEIAQRFNNSYDLLLDFFHLRASVYWQIEFHKLVSTKSGRLPLQMQLPCC